MFSSDYKATGVLDDSGRCISLHESRAACTSESTTQSAGGGGGGAPQKNRQASNNALKLWRVEKEIFLTAHARRHAVKMTVKLVWWFWTRPVCLDSTILFSSDLEQCALIFLDVPKKKEKKNYLDSLLQHKDIVLTKEPLKVGK